MRGFNIGTFRAAFAEADVLRPNLFLVEFQIPRGMLGTEFYLNNVNTVRKLEYFCERAALPDQQLRTYPALRYGYGTEEKRPFQTQFSDITLSIVNDAADDRFRFFHQWMNVINNFDMRTRRGPYLNGPEEATWTVAHEKGGMGQAVRRIVSPFELSYKDEYVTEARIIAFDNTGRPARSCVLRDAFPTFIGPVQTDWADNASYMRLPIALTFTDWWLEFIGE